MALETLLPSRFRFPQKRCWCCGASKRRQVTMPTPHQGFEILMVSRRRAQRGQSLACTPCPPRQGNHCRMHRGEGCQRCSWVVVGSPLSDIKGLGHFFVQRKRTFLRWASLCHFRSPVLPNGVAGIYIVCTIAYILCASLLATGSCYTNPKA